MPKVKRYSEVFWNTLIRIFIYGVLLGCVFALLAFFILLYIPVPLLWRLYEIFRWPEGIFTGVIVSAGVILLRRTTVEIEGDKVSVSRVGYKERFELSQFMNSSIRRKVHIGSFSKFVTVKCYLIFIVPSGIRKCRLYGFGERELEKLLEAMRSSEAEYLTDEEKAAIMEKYSREASEALIYGREGDNEFRLPASLLVKKERDFLRKISLIMLGIIAVVGILDAYEILGNHTFSIQLFFASLLASLLLILIIASYIGLGIKRGICAERIIVDGTHLQVGGQYYAYSGIEQIRLTSPRKRSSSIFPVQRYMYIAAEGRTKKYWLGSQVSFGLYEDFCMSLERGIASYPGKLVYR